MQAQMANMQAQTQTQMATLTEQLTNLQELLTNSQALQLVINANSRRRIYNSKAFNDKPLIPLLCENPGSANFNTSPIEIFPVNIEVVLGQTTNAQLNELQEFYGENFSGNSVIQKRKSFLNFIGV